MIYQCFEFINLKSVKKTITSNKNETISYLDYSSSTIVDVVAYQNFIDETNKTLKNSHVITTSVKRALTKIANLNNFSDRDRLQMINTIYNCFSNPYNYSLELLSSLVNNELAYFVSLVIIQQYSLQDYNLQKYIKVVQKEYNDNYSEEEEILTYETYQEHLDFFKRKNENADEFTEQRFILIEILPDYTYVDLGTFLTSIEYAKSFGIETIVNMMKITHPFLQTLDSNADYQIYYYYLLSVYYNENIYNKYDDTEYPIYSSYFFFIFLSSVILPKQNDALDLLIKEVGFQEDVVFYTLYNLHKAVDIQVTKVEEITTSKAAIKEYPFVKDIDKTEYQLRSFTMQDDADFKLISHREQIVDNIKEIKRNKLTYHSTLSSLLLASDSNIEKVVFRFNTPLIYLAKRIDLLYHKLNVRKNNTYWLCVSNSKINTFSNRNMLTPAARAAVNEGKIYAEYTNETMLNLWTYNKCKYFFIFYSLNNTSNAYSLQDLENAIVDNTLFKENKNDEFPLYALTDLIELLEHSNCTYFTSLLKSLRKILAHKNSYLLCEFYRNYCEKTIAEQILIRKYFYCYFLLVNYSRFWLGPGHSMQHCTVNKDSLLLLYRDKQIQRIIILLQSYQEKIKDFLGDNWYDNLYLFTDFNTKLIDSYEDIHRNGVTKTYNSSKLYDRIQLITEGTFCMATNCEQAKYIIYAIIVYLKGTNFIEINDHIEIKNYLQTLTDEILPLIVQDMLKTNPITQQLTNPTYEYDIYKNMSGYYYILKNTSNDLVLENANNDLVLENTIKDLIFKDLPNEQRQLLAVPLFLLPLDYCKLQLDNSIIRVPINQVTKMLKFLKIEARANNSYELFDKPYEYYNVVFEYQLLQNYLRNNCKQDIGDLNQYYNIYHTTSKEDATNITNYVEYY